MDTETEEELLIPINMREYLEPKLVENLEYAVKVKLGNNEPYGLIIDGKPGLAKTTSAIMIARFLQPSFNIEHQVGRGLKQFIKAYNYTIRTVTEEVKVCIYDEANDADKSGSMTKLLRVLNQMLSASSREEKVIVIVILHRFYRLDEKPFDNGLIDMLLNFYEKIEGKYSKFRAYDLDCMLYMVSMIKRGKVFKKPKVYGFSSPNFYGKFKSPPNSLQLEINKFSKKGKDLLREQNTKEILNYKYLSVDSIADKLGVNTNRINYIIRNNKLKEKYLKDSFGKKFFYSPDILHIVKKYIK